MIKNENKILSDTYLKVHRYQENTSQRYMTRFSSKHEKTAKRKQKEI